MTTFKKFAALLDHVQRRQALGLLGLMLIGMVLEIFGIGLVIPALIVISDSDFPTSHPILQPALTALRNPTQVQLVIGGMLAMVCAYATKSVFLVYLTWRQFSFVFGVQAALSLKLFTGYLRQPYPFHLRRNSAELVRNIVNETRILCFSFMIPGLFLLAEALIVLAILTLLLVIEPVGALTVIVPLGLASIAFVYFSKTRILLWGRARQYHEGARQQHLQQGLDAHKEVGLLGREADFIALFATHNTGAAQMERKHNTIQALPRLWLELLAVVGLTMLVISMIVQGKSVVSIIPALGVFAAAAFRLIPSVNRVLGSAQHVRYALPVISTLYDELGLFAHSRVATSAGALPFSQSIQLRDLGFTHAGSTNPTLTGISLSIPRGSCVGFVGESGSGKSTLIDIILGLLTPTQGQVLIDGHDIQLNLRGWQDQLGYVSQNIYLTDDTLRRNVAFGIAREQIDESAVRRAITTAQLDEFVRSLPDGLDTRIGERGVRISGGQRQRIGIARAVYQDPPVLVLDEATSSLDVATERDVMGAVNALQGDKTILIVAHRHSALAGCAVLYRLEAGRLVLNETTAESIR